MLIGVPQPNVQNDESDIIDDEHVSKEKQCNEKAVESKKGKNDDSKQETMKLQQNIPDDTTRKNEIYNTDITFSEDSDVKITTSIIENETKGSYSNETYKNCIATKTCCDKKVTFDKNFVTKDEFEHLEREFKEIKVQMTKLQNSLETFIASQIIA
uniref:Uncharacterized protein n=1 Tax=Panagrolaimus davidi TaxID=227884 RepID=A0A914QLS3_9BILA